jgi:hypothetical protein
METRMIKNVCAPAVVLRERIVIVGGESGRVALGWIQTALPIEIGSLIDRWCSTGMSFKIPSHPPTGE